jgi:hypothetical protein
MGIFCVLVVVIVVFFYFTTKELMSEMREKEKNLGVKYKLVSAGSIKKRKEAYVWLNDQYARELFVLDGKIIDKSDYTLFVVDGKSMRKFGIESGDIVLVSEDKNPPVTDTSIFVINVYPVQRNKSEYKLRKPIDFYDCRDDSEAQFVEWIEQYPRLDTEMLKNLYTTDLRDKIAECNRLGCRLLVSETTRKGKVHYSFHPEKRIFGKVEHLIQNENVEIIEKG